MTVSLKYAKLLLVMVSLAAFLLLVGGVTRADETSQEPVSNEPMVDAREKQDSQAIEIADETEYEIDKDGYTKDPATDPWNEHISVQVSSIGRFNMGANPNPENGGYQTGSFNMMYYWPSNPGTSYSTVRVDGQDFVYGSSGTVVQPPIDDNDAGTNRSSWMLPSGIKVTQTLTIVEGQGTGKKDTAEIRYELENTSAEEHNVGLRVMIDSMLDRNDGALFRVPGLGNFTTEREFVGEEVPDYFLSMRSFTDSEHVAASTFRGGAATPPDKVIIGTWPGLVQNEFDYTPSANRSIARDSAYAVYWTNRSLPAGEKVSFVNYYGASGITQDLRPPLGVNMFAPTSLSVNDENILVGNPFTVSADVRNLGNGPAQNVVASLESSPEGLEVEGPKGKNLGTLDPGQEEPVQFRVRAPESSTDKTYTLRLIVTADEVERKVVQREIFVPKNGGDSRTPLILVPGIAGSKLEYAEDVPQYDSNGNLVGYEHRAGDEKWPQLKDTGEGLFDRHLLSLQLAPDGEQPYKDDPEYGTAVGDIWREETANVYGVREITLDEYRTTIETLTSEYGYTEGETLFVFPYDWRKDIGGSMNDTTQSKELLKKIDDVRQETGVDKVNILAHSQGGLATLAALRDPQSSSKVDKAMTLGTPVLGATKSLAVFDKQACFGGPGPSLDGCAIFGGTARVLFQNFPGAYQLFPSRAFHNAEGSPVTAAETRQAGPGTPEEEYELKDLSYDEWIANIKEDGNARLIDEAEDFHNRYDDLVSEPLVDPSVDLVRVVGAGLSTPDYILETNRFCGGNGPCSYTELRYTREGSIEGGDGTVPIHSADLYNPDSESDFDLRNGVPNVYEWAVEHGELQKDPDILEMANSYFNEDPDDNISGQANAEDEQPILLAMMDFLGMRTAQAQSDDDQNIAELARQSGLHMQPTSFSGVELQTIGSVQSRVEDTGGNVLGALPDQERGELPRGFIVEEIEGGDYNRIGDDPTQSFFLNESGSYTGTLTIEEQDDVEIRVRTYDEGKTTGTAIFYLNRLIGGKLPQGARVQLGFQSGGDLKNLRLQIDEDADGTPERQLAPYSVISGADASDQTPQTATAITRVVEPERGSRPRPTKARVALKAQDGPDGSGIGAIYYRLEGERQLRLYEEPFTIPLNTTIYYGAVDKAGNASPLQKLLVDDTPDSLRTAELITTKDRIKRYIDPKGDRDWFVFEADGASRYTVQLYGLPEDYDLGVYDQSGKEIASSPRRKKKTEKVTIKSSAGRYYLRVVGYEGAWTEKLPYHLKVDKRSGGRQDNG